MEDIIVAINKVKIGTSKRTVFQFDRWMGQGLWTPKPQ